MALKHGFLSYRCKDDINHQQLLNVTQSLTEEVGMSCHDKKITGHLS